MTTKELCKQRIEVLLQDFPRLYLSVKYHSCCSNDIGMTNYNANTPKMCVLVSCYQARQGRGEPRGCNTQEPGSGRTRKCLFIKRRPRAVTWEGDLHQSAVSTLGYLREQSQLQIITFLCRKYFVLDLFGHTRQELSPYNYVFQLLLENVVAYMKLVGMYLLARRDTSHSRAGLTMRLRLRRTRLDNRRCQNPRRISRRSPDNTPVLRAGLTMRLRLRRTRLDNRRCQNPRRISRRSPDNTPVLSGVNDETAVASNTIRQSQVPKPATCAAMRRVAHLNQPAADAKTRQPIRGASDLHSCNLWPPVFRELCHNGLVVVHWVNYSPPGFSLAGRRVYSGITLFPRPCTLALLHTHLIGSQDLDVKGRSLYDTRTTFVGAVVIYAMQNYSRESSATRLVILSQGLNDTHFVSITQSMDPSGHFPIVGLDAVVKHTDHQNYPTSSFFASSLSQVRIVPDDAAGRRVFSGISRFPSPYIPALLHTYSPHFTLIGSQYLDLNSRPNLFTHSLISSLFPSPPPPPNSNHVFAVHGKLRVQGQEASERYGRLLDARLVLHRSYAQDVQGFRRNAVLYKLDL
ncbi:hypothetical protein PR048_019210 [Dryococelus australis]|uniref:Uncharacterized protein n=1 Tax=Dryococelus australis TaxID=614101 RepID=A0ABQ9H2W7_9NEOP|nr:hypothetical protein PR048_019210 [Dryococelus australis]